MHQAARCSALGVRHRPVTARRLSRWLCCSVVRGLRGRTYSRTPRHANTVATLDHRLSCKDVASMFLGCSLVVSSFLLPLFVPYCPRSRHPRHPKTRALQPSPPPSARAPIRSRRPASRQPAVATPNIETAAAWSRLQGINERRPADVQKLSCSLDGKLVKIGLHSRAQEEYTWP